MDIKNLDNLIRGFVKNFNRDEFKAFMQHVDLLHHQYKLYPDALHKFLTSNNEPQEMNSMIDNRETEKNIQESVINEEIQIKTECIEVDNMVKSIKNRPYLGLACRKSSILKSESEDSIERNFEIENLCRVCEHRNKSSYFYGPGVCDACRSFFSRVDNLKDQLKCIFNNDCISTGKLLTCRKCRLDKCLSIGMKKPEKISQESRTSDCKPQKLERHSICLSDSSCLICYSKSSKRGIHYGIRMCKTCAKWYSINKKYSEIISRSKCVQKDKTKINRCYKAKELCTLSCRKCRLKKIQELIRSTN